MRLLDKLESVDGMKRETEKKRIAVVELSGNESIGKANCGRAIKNRADLTKLTNVIEGRRASGRDVLVEGWITVKQDTKVSTVRGWRKNGGAESNGNGGELKTLLERYQ